MSINQPFVPNPSIYCGGHNYLFWLNRQGCIGCVKCLGWFDELLTAIYDIWVLVNVEFNLNYLAG